MASSTSKPWDPSAPSLLWAHEIRRETIHLANELDKAKTTVSSAVSATTTAQQSIIELQRAVLELENKNLKLSEELDRVKQIASECGCEELAQKVAVLEDGQGEVVNSAKRIKAFEKHIEVEVEMNGEVLELVRKMARGEVEKCLKEIEERKESSRSGTQATDSTQNLDIVPDSMPVDKTASQTGRKHSLQKISSTASPSTWSEDSTEVDESYVTDRTRRVKKRQYQDLTEDTRVPITQGERSLCEYLLAVENIRAELPVWEQEGCILDEFVRGLDDPEATAVAEEYMNYYGKMWSVIKTSLLRIINNREAQAANAEKQVPQDTQNKDESVGKAKANGEHHKPKKRRFIPIVPPDEDDMVFST